VSGGGGSAGQEQGRRFGRKAPGPLNPEIGAIGRGGSIGGEGVHKGRRGVLQEDDRGFEKRPRSANIHKAAICRERVPVGGGSVAGEKKKKQDCQCFSGEWRANGGNRGAVS